MVEATFSSKWNLDKLIREEYPIFFCNPFLGVGCPLLAGETWKVPDRSEFRNGGLTSAHVLIPVARG